MRALLAVVLLAAGLAHAQSEIILDNGSAAFSATGAWPASTAVPGFIGPNYQSHEANGAPPSGIVVDNTDAGFSVTGTWPGSTAVSGYTGTNYQVHAANGEPPSGIVADNSSGSATGTWPLSTAVSGYYGTNYQVHVAGSGANVFSWALAVPSAGTYQVYARWTSHPNRATNAKYTVNHASGSQIVTVNQEQGSGQWNLLGSFSFNAGPATVSLSDDANDYVVADAVMLVPPGASPNTATWTLAVPVPGSYQVYARWTAHPNRATDAKYTVNHAAGSTQVTVNMEAGGGNWSLLGTFDFNAGNATVNLTDQANGYVIADAVMLAPPGAAPNTATWTPNVAQAGTYEVYARWTQHTNRATNATYIVTHGTGTTAVSVNQQQGGGGWILLGTFPLSPGAAHKVSLTDQANGYVIADAVRLVPVNLVVEKKLYFVHVDHVNTPRLVANAGGQTVWRWDHQEPFGVNAADENLSSLGTFEFNLRFPGQYFDKESNLVQNWMRDYDSQAGRYIQSDPIGLGAGLNTYAYANGMPVSLIDPQGLSSLNACANPVNAAACMAAGIGGMVSGATALVNSLAAQLNQASCPADINWNQVTIATGTGILTGIASGALSTSQFVVNAASWYPNYVARQQLVKTFNLYQQLMNSGAGAQIQFINNNLLKYGGPAGAAQVQAINRLISQGIADPKTDPVVRQTLMSLQSLM